MGVRIPKMMVSDKYNYQVCKYKYKSFKQIDTAIKPYKLALLCILLQSIYKLGRIYSTTVLHCNCIYTLLYTCCTACYAFNCEVQRQKQTKSQLGVKFLKCTWEMNGSLKINLATCECSTGIMAMLLINNQVNN